MCFQVNPPRHLFVISICLVGTRRGGPACSQITFPSIASSSSLFPTFGTSTPHLRSLVTALGLNPSPSILGSTICPSAVMTGLLPHLPFACAFRNHSSRRGWRMSSRKQAWVEGRTETVWFLLRLQRGWRSAVGDEKVMEHLSHWSPRASWWGINQHTAVVRGIARLTSYPQLGQVPSTNRSAKNSLSSSQ